MHEQGFYEQHEIELLTGTTVTAIDPGGIAGHARGRRASSRSTGCC